MRMGMWIFGVSPSLTSIRAREPRVAMTEPAGMHEDFNGIGHRPLSVFPLRPGRLANLTHYGISWRP